MKNRDTFSSCHPVVCFLYFGPAAAVMISVVIRWFSCYNEVVASDKLVCRFGERDRLARTLTPALLNVRADRRRQKLQRMENCHA